MSGVRSLGLLLVLASGCTLVRPSTTHAPGEEIRVTASPESESDPRWSPDGKYLAFLASRGDEVQHDQQHPAVIDHPAELVDDAQPLAGRSEAGTDARAGRDDEPGESAQRGLARRCRIGGPGVLDAGVAVSRPMGLQAADEEVHLLGHAKALAANLDEIAGFDQRLHVPLEGGPILARHLEQLQQFPDAGRVVHAVAHQRKDLVP